MAVEQNTRQLVTQHSKAALTALLKKLDPLMVDRQLIQQLMLHKLQQEILYKQAQQQPRLV